MAEYACFVRKENVRMAENKLRSDFDLAAKQSITVKDAGSLGIEADGSFFYITGSDEGVAKCKELLEEFVAEAREEDISKAKEGIRKEQEAAAAGFGGIFG